MARITLLLGLGLGLLLQPLLAWAQRDDAWVAGTATFYGDILVSDSPRGNPLWPCCCTFASLVA